MEIGTHECYDRLNYLKLAYMSWKPDLAVVSYSLPSKDITV